jgi:hypothetical protein
MKCENVYFVYTFLKTYLIPNGPYCYKIIKIPDPNTREHVMS